MFGDVERAMRHFRPEVLVLCPMLVDTWRVADDAEAHKRHLLEVAHLSDGGTLHVHCQTIGELRFDVCQNRVIGDKLIASANQPCVDFRLNRSIFHHLSCT